MTKVDNKKLFEERLEKYISNMEQLGADARVENDNKNYDKLLVKLNSINCWCSLAIGIVKRLEGKE